MIILPVSNLFALWLHSYNVMNLKWLNSEHIRTYEKFMIYGQYLTISWKQQYT